MLDIAAETAPEPLTLDQITDVQNGKTGAFNELYTMLYPQLRALARKLCRGERPGQTLQATGVVNELYTRLVESGARKLGDNRREFTLFVSKAMRNIITGGARAQA